MAETVTVGTGWGWGGRFPLGLEVKGRQWARRDGGVVEPTFGDQRDREGGETARAWSGSSGIIESMDEVRSSANEIPETRGSRE